MMRRREFITLLGGAAAWPLTARAQPPRRMPRVGMLMSGRAEDPQTVTRVSTLRRAFSDLGWTEGRNVEFVIRYGSADADRMRLSATQLVEASPDVILGQSVSGAKALFQATRTIPVVFLLVSDPVGSGTVQSFARPGGNFTGFSYYEPGMSGKCIEFLRDLNPKITKLAVLFNPDMALNVEFFLRPLELAARNYNVSVARHGVRNAQEIEQAFDVASRESGNALFLFPETYTLSQRKLIIAQAQQHKLPAIYPFKVFAIDGGLMSFGANVLEQHRQAASYVDRILRGDRAADLPVQAPTKFEFVINLKTAKALGLEVPPMLLTRADEVIE
jgi:ABC-type uncharacterized transport system substrate-binding protein